MTPDRTVDVISSARLHFGLWAWGSEHERQFGGVGMMISKPRLQLRFTTAPAFTVSGPMAERFERAAESCRIAWRLRELPPCHVQAIELPPVHAGFGVGTQLALSLARGLAEYIGDRDCTTTGLAIAAGRGLRSAVGTHGFALGGLIVDAGKAPHDAVGALGLRLAVPEEWRVVLITPSGERGIAGEAEITAFAKVPPVPIDTTARLQQLASKQLAPACQVGDFDRFATALHEYGYTAGMCFESIQGGPYASRQIAATVAQLKELGAVGVGQSSWGPTIYALASCEEAATDLADRYQKKVGPSKFDIMVSKPNNNGVSVETSC